MVRRYQIRLMRSVNARCVSIGLVLALSNCSESGGEPDSMLDMHHPGTGIDSHHPQFHNSYGNMKFIIIVINPISKLALRATLVIAIGSRARARSASQVLDVSRGASLFARSPLPPSFSALCVWRWTPIADTNSKQVSLSDRSANFFDEETREMELTSVHVEKLFFLSSSPSFIIINKKFSLLLFLFSLFRLFRISHFY